jgi:membrane-associated PAP2 superfamily phosphatase
MFPTAPRRDAFALFLALLTLLAWDASGLDLALMHWWGGPGGFPWREHWLTRGVLHDGGRWFAHAMLLVLAINVWRPLPFARALPRRERTAWLLATVSAALVVGLVKRHSLTSCPWSLVDFGGAAHYVSHWQWGALDGGEGHCFPSGHASAAFALLTGGYALAGVAPRAARRWTLGVLAAGTLFGLAQWMRGAHYVSHTLWAAWLCWAAAALAFGVLRRVRRAPAPAPQPAA